MIPTRLLTRIFVILQTAAGFFTPVLLAQVERPVSAPRYGAAPGLQGQGITASDGENFFLLWQDLRGTPGTYAARVGYDGRILDPTGIRLALGPYFSTRALVFAGNAYVALGGSTANRISRDGRTLPPSGLANPLTSDMTVATNGDRIVLASKNTVAVMDSEGRLLERDIPLANDMPWTPKIAASRFGFLVLWEGRDGATYAHALDRVGHPLATETLVARVGYPVAVASDGANYLVIYNSRESGNPRQRFAQVVNERGELVGSPRPIPPAYVYDLTNLGWSGTNYVLAGRVANDQDRFLGAIRLRQDGEPIDASPMRIVDLNHVAAYYGGDTFAVGGGKFLFGWAQNHGSSIDDFDQFAIVVDGATLSHDPPFIVSLSAAAQMAPSLASDGVSSLVAWQEDDAVFTNLLDRNGIPIDPNGTKLSGLEGGREPRVVFDGEHYAVVWRATTFPYDLRRARMSPSGAIVDAIVLPGTRSMYGSSFALATDGVSTLLVWAGYEKPGLFATKFNRAGQMTESFPVASLPPPQAGWPASPAVAWNGEEWLLAFEQRTINDIILPPTYWSEIYAVRMSPALTVLDPQPLAIDGGDRRHNLSPVVAGSPGEFLITWTHAGSQAQARRVPLSGAVGPVLDVAEGIPAAAVWEGQSYAVGIVKGPADFADPYQLSLFRVGRDGVTSLASAMGPTLMSFSNYLPTMSLLSARNHLFAAYPRFSLEPEYGGVTRVFVRDLATPPRSRAVHRR